MNYCYFKNEIVCVVAYILLQRWLGGEFSKGFLVVKLEEGPTIDVAKHEKGLD